MREELRDEIDVVLFAAIAKDSTLTNNTSDILEVVLQTSVLETCCPRTPGACLTTTCPSQQQQALVRNVDLLFDQPLQSVDAGGRQGSSLL